MTLEKPVYCPLGHVMQSKETVVGRLVGCADCGIEPAHLSGHLASKNAFWVQPITDLERAMIRAGKTAKPWV